MASGESQLQLVASCSRLCVSFERQEPSRQPPCFQHLSTCAFVADAATHQSYLEKPEVLGALDFHVLPLLGLRDLAACSCTCTALRALTYQQDQLWLRAAAASLPPSLSIASRAAVQNMMQRRADACKHIVSGRQSTLIELPIGSEGSVCDMRFSQEGHLLAIINVRRYQKYHVQVFAVSDGSRVWQREFEEGFAKNIPAYLSWHFAFNCLTACAAPVKEALQLNLFQFEAQTGSLVSCTTTVPEIVPEPNLVFLTERPRFSPDGKSLALLVSVRPQQNSAERNRRYMLAVLEVATRDLQLLLDLQEFALLTGTPVWSRDMSLLALQGCSADRLACLHALVRLQSGNVITLGGIMQHHAVEISFDATTSLLGRACKRDLGDHGRNQDLAVFNDALSGQQLLVLENRIFSGFLSTTKLALVVQSDNFWHNTRTAQIWDVAAVCCLHTFELPASALLHSAAGLLLLNSFVPACCEHGLVLYQIFPQTAETADAFLPSTACFSICTSAASSCQWWKCSPDEINFVVCTGLSASPDKVSLVKLC